MPSDAALRDALNWAVAHYVDPANSNAHGAYIGLRTKNGRETDEPCVVVCVPRKMSPLELQLQNEPAIVSAIYTQRAEHVRLDVLAAPRPEVKLLWAPHAMIQASDIHAMCHQPTIGGGAQIQPANANWVGTFGMMLRSGGKIAAITNAHVTGIDASAGLTIHQPLKTNRDWFAKVVHVQPISFASNARNLVDLAVLDGRDADGLHNIKPEQIGLGRLGTKHVSATLGLRVVKAGRTTGVTYGRCVGVGGVQIISYGSGKNARFVDQDIFRGEDGQLFSDAGDSGSAILTADTLDFVSHLFAGGGDITIGCPARHVLAAIDGALFVN